MIYFDATFLARLYVEDAGFEEVRAVVQDSGEVQSSIWGRMETEAVFHRKYRENYFDRETHAEVNTQFSKDAQLGLLSWLPFTPEICERVHLAFLKLPPDVFLRTGDAIHLATASEAGFKEIYSNDRHLLAAASLFKLKGINPLSK